MPNAWERSEGWRYRFNDQHKNAILRWWTGNQYAEDDYLTDPEMYAQLWGEWEGYQVGSLVVEVQEEGGNQVSRPAEKDWAAGGYIMFFYPRGK